MMENWMPQNRISFVTTDTMLALSNACHSEWYKQYRNAFPVSHQRVHHSIISFHWGGSWLETEPVNHWVCHSKWYKQCHNIYPVSHQRLHHSIISFYWGHSWLGIECPIITVVWSVQNHVGAHHGMPLCINSTIILIQECVKVYITRLYHFTEEVHYCEKNPIITR